MCYAKNGHMVVVLLGRGNGGAALSLGIATNILGIYLDLKPACGLKKLT